MTIFLSGCKEFLSFAQQLHVEQVPSAPRQAVASVGVIQCLFHVSMLTLPVLFLTSNVLPQKIHHLSDVLQELENMLASAFSDFLMHSFT